MQREIKFKFWLNNEKKMTYDHSLHEIGYIFSRGDTWDENTIPLQYTGLKDKNGKEIYEGDRLKIKWVQQNWQTHTGDNIPFGGSYTEPDTSTIEEVNDGGYVVIFERGAFRIGGEYDMPNGCYDDSLEMFLSNHWWEDVFHNMDDNYFEGDGYPTLEELKKECGVEVIGNIYENPELLNSDKNVQGDKK